MYELATNPLEDALDDSNVEPLENGWGSFGEFQLVGQGKATNVFCGKHIKIKGCLRVELHNRITLDGQSFRGKVYARDVQHWCDKPSCPICFKHGWAVREAGNIRDRLAEAKRFGQVEHVVASVPQRDYGLSFDALREKVDKVLLSRRIIGGVKIFHGFRYDKRLHWYWSPHFHVLGFILGGYSRCRHCDRKWNCLKGCGGFDDGAYQKFLMDGWIVKVKGERITVFGTAWYQLNHASVRVGVVRFQVATWFGVCSYRKMKVTVEKREDLCPLCKHDLVDVRYFGVKQFVWDRSSPEYKRERYEDYLEDGRPVWVEVVRSSRYGSGSYA